MRKWILLSALLLAGCLFPDPGQGPRARLGYAAAWPVTDALEAYRTAQGAYPDSLPQLVPTFLPAAALAEPLPGYPLRYVRNAEGYALTFRYVGPGMNWCTWTPRSRRWDCGGYF
jgi:hypothetical protein